MIVDKNDLTVSELPRDDVLHAFGEASRIEGRDAQTVRRDECGTEIHLDEYSRETDYGWQVALITVDAATDKRNFRAMHVSNVASRSGQEKCWPCMNMTVICDADQIEKLLS